MTIPLILILKMTILFKVSALIAIKANNNKVVSNSGNLKSNLLMSTNIKNLVKFGDLEPAF